MPNKKGVYPGTFDPITNGHLDMIIRASRVVDHLVVAVADNDVKSPLFSLEDRIEMVKHEISCLNLDIKIEVKPLKTLLMNFVKEEEASLVIRGLRAVSDFEYEFKMCVMNRRLNRDVETIFLMASEKTQFISSIFVKEVGRLGGDISSFVSPYINGKLQDIFLCE